MGIFSLSKIIEYTFSTEGIKKIGETKPGVIDNPSVDLAQMNKISGVSTPNGHPEPLRNGYITSTFNSNGNGNGSAKENGNGNGKGMIHISRKGSTLTKSPSTRPPFLAAVLDGLDLLCSMRGIGWEYGTGSKGGLFIPTETRTVSSRSKFLLETLVSFLGYFTALDFISACVKLVPGVGTTQGGSIFAFGRSEDGSVDFVKMYAAAVGINFATGMAFVVGG